VKGIDTTLPFHESILKSIEFLEARVHTRWIEENVMREKGL
jgi:biotin carboxylase